MSMDTLEFAGITWLPAGASEADGYRAHIHGQDKARISQYNSDSPSAGRWHWIAHIDEAIPKCSVADNYLSGIEYTRDDALCACVNALDDYIADICNILAHVRPGSDYAKGWADGRAAMAALVNAEVDRALTEDLTAMEAA